MYCIATHGRIIAEVLLQGIWEETTFGYIRFFIRNFLDRLRITTKASVSLDGQWKKIQNETPLKEFARVRDTKYFEVGVQPINIV
jgi:hypothetical protein